MCYQVTTKKVVKKENTKCQTIFTQEKTFESSFKVMPSVVIPAGSEAFEGSAAFSGVLETMEAPLTASRNLAMKASVCSGVLNLKYSQE